MLVSIIIPVYNCEKYIVEAIESVLQQTYRNFEILIINDGSIDNTEKKIEKYKNNSKVRYYYKTNGGEASARNFGLAKAKGEYITFLDADDLYSKDKIEKQLSIFMSKPTIDVVYNDVFLIDEQSNKIGILKSEKIISEPSNFLAQILFRQIVPASASIMLRRKCIDDIRFPENLKHAVDYAFIIQLAMNFNFFYLEETIYSYRRHTNNLTNNHLNQVKCEKEIVTSLGIKKIKNIVCNTTYPEIEKVILLVKILLKIEKYEDALEEINKIHSDDWEYYFITGVLFYFLKEYKKAIFNFELSKDIEERAETINNLGCCYYKQNNFKQAEIYFIKASKLRNLYNDPVNNLKAIQLEGNVKITERVLRKQLTNYNS